MIELNIGFKLLKEQIKDLLESNIKEDSKAGLHELLGAIYDLKDELNKKKYVEIRVVGT